MNGPLFSQLGRARVQCCEDEPPSGVLPATRPLVRWTTSSLLVDEGAAESPPSICAPAEGRSVLALARPDRRVAKQLEPRKLAILPADMDRIVIVDEADMTVS